MAMIARKPSLLLAACNSILPHTPPTYQSSTSSDSRTRRGTRQQTCLHERRNGYATIASGPRDTNESQERSEPEHVWPKAPKGQTNPTPYQILDTKMKDAYSKAKYYELVKLYHPDLNISSNQSMSETLKIERYRLIVAAHTILSDPVRRSAYDRFGAGWNGRSDLGHPDSWRQPSPHDKPGPFSQSWRNNGDPSIWQNATWEDWEKWHRARDGTASKKPSPIYMANSYFVMMLAVLALIGSSLNMNRASDAGHYFLEQRDIVHDRASKELRRVRQEKSTLNTREERIEFFVRQREATLRECDYDAIREERAHRMLKDREVCSSEQVRDRDGG